MQTIGSLIILYIFAILTVVPFALEVIVQWQLGRSRRWLTFSIVIFLVIIILTAAIEAGRPRHWAELLALILIELLMLLNFLTIVRSPLNLKTRVTNKWQAWACWVILSGLLGDLQWAKILRRPSFVLFIFVSMVTLVLHLVSFGFLVQENDAVILQAIGSFIAQISSSVFLASLLYRARDRFEETKSFWPALLCALFGFGASLTSLLCLGLQSAFSRQLVSTESTCSECESS
jgi:hypothetical protein